MRLKGYKYSKSISCRLDPSKGDFTYILFISKFIYHPSTFFQYYDKTLTLKRFTETIIKNSFKYNLTYKHQLGTLQNNSPPFINTIVHKNQLNLLSSLMKQGKVTFVPNFTKTQLHNIISYQDFNRLNQDIWYINKTRPTRLPLIFDYIELFSISNLAISGSICTQKMFLKITSIKFDKLHTLNIIESSLNNIEALAFLDAPSVQRIMLRKTKITHVSKALNKTMFPQLSIITLQDCFVNQISLSRCRIHPDGTRLHNFSKGADNLVDDLSFLCKLRLSNQNLILLYSLLNFMQTQTSDTAQIVQKKVIAVLLTLLKKEKPTIASQNFH